MEEFDEKTICEVNQFIEEVLTEEQRDKLPLEIKAYFNKNAKNKEKYEVDYSNIETLKEKLNEKTWEYISLFREIIKSDFKYIQIEPHWEEISNIKEKVEQLELEIASNFYNIHNLLADRKFEKVEYIYDFKLYGLTFDEEKAEKLFPVKLLLRVFILAGEKLKKEEKYDELYEKYIYVANEIKKLLKTF